MRKSGLFIVIIMLICSIVIWPYQTSYADEVTTEEVKVQDAVMIGKVELKDGVQAGIKNLIALPSENGQIVSFVVNIHNQNNTEFSFGDYWVELYTKSGSKLSLNLDGDANTKVQGKTSKDLIFYSKVSEHINISDLKIRMVKWNFSSSDYVDRIGEITVPQRYNPAIPAGYGREIALSNTKSIISVERSTIGKSDKYYKSEIRLMVNNNGKTTLVMPDLKMYIVTSKNFMYPITVTSFKDTRIDPLDEKEFNLSANIPITVEEGNWKLALMYTANEGKDMIPLAAFDLPKSATDSPGDSKREFTISTNDGLYHAKLDSLNRLPLEDNDLIVANLTITNRSDQTLPVPNFTGEFTFNNKVKRSVTVSQNTKVIALLPEESTTLQIAASIPYTFEINKADLLLQQKQSDGNEIYDLVEFTNIGTFDSIPKLGSKQGFDITDVGYRSTVLIKNKMTYVGRTGNIVSAHLIITNNEKRQADMQRLAGYFEKEDGTIYPATIQHIKEKLPPGGTAMAIAQAVVPANVDLNGVRLVVGKALSESVSKGSAEGDPQTVITGYVSPYSIEMPNERKEQDNLLLVDVAPYTLTINRIRTQIEYGAAQIKLDIDYTLDQDLLTKADLTNHKIIFELKDNAKGATFYAQFPISTDPNPASIDNSKLYPGKHKLEFPAWQDPDLLLNIQTLKDYSFSIYEEIQPGYKKLIAVEKSIPWMVDRVLDTK